MHKILRSINTFWRHFHNIQDKDKCYEIKSNKMRLCKISVLNPEVLMAVNVVAEKLWTHNLYLTSYFVSDFSSSCSPKSVTYCDSDTSPFSRLSSAEILFKRASSLNQTSVSSLFFSTKLNNFSHIVPEKNCLVWSLCKLFLFY